MTRRNWFRAAAGFIAALVAPKAVRAAVKPRGTIYAADMKRFPGAVLPPGWPVRCFDAATEEEVLLVIYYDTATRRLGRYRCDVNGVICMCTEDGRLLDDPDEVWETRPLRLVPFHCRTSTPACPVC
jgi:hypothetical protein